MQKNHGSAFDRVIVIGYGKVTGEVLRFVCGRQEEYGYRTEFIEHEVHPFSVTEKICSENHIPFARITDKQELAGIFLQIEEKTLIVSASNNFIFPGALMEQENITVINFHNALLPDYAGRNAPTWVIYNGEEETGITWHYVTGGVDEGDIIIQKHCGIGPDTKAYELTERLMDLASEAFRECFGDVIKECAAARPQRLDPARRMFRSREVPAGGVFAMTDTPEHIYRLLRSVDYGKNDIFPPICTQIDGRKAEILRYRRISPDRRRDEEGTVCLPLADGDLLKLKYRYTDQ